VLIETASDPQTQQTAFNVFVKWVPYAIPTGGVLISLFGLIINWRNRADATRARLRGKEGEKDMQDQAIRIAMADIEKRFNERLNQRASRNLQFQLATALVLFLLIGGIGGYLWIVTARIQSAIQPDQLRTAIGNAIQTTTTAIVSPKKTGTASSSSHKARKSETSERVTHKKDD
jgi:hypothetical protein